ncbi:MAG: sigma-70 family RNA polymerase sigma factor [Bacteroidetes bacterium]|nr:sigma-70 family RNA polymerase sigma factor [Bacteroidota bacterium]
MNDDAIIQCIRQNQYHPAMKKLYAYFPVIRKFIVKNHGTRQEAEDIFQEGLIIFCRKALSEDFVLSSRIDTYLYGVCRYLWLDELKKKNKMPLQETNTGHIASETPEYEADVHEDQHVKTAQQAVARLGEKCRALLELFYFKKRSLKEIAQELGFSSEKTAKNQKYRCIEKARGYYHELTH